MNEYTWEILSLYTAPQENGLPDVVKKINWRFQVTDGSYYGDVYDVTELDSPDKKKYIKYENLSEETIIGWIKSKRNYDELVKIAQDRLDKNKNPEITEKPVPWEYPLQLTGEEQYLVVIDDQPNDLKKIWGPLMWDSGRINTGLKERGFDSLSVPDNMIMYRKGLIPIDQPLVLSDRVKIYRVDYTPQPTFDEVFEYNQGLTWVLSTGRAVGTYYILDKSLNQIKDTLLEFAKQRRNQKLFTPADFTLNGKKFLTYTDAQTFLLATNKSQLMSDSDVINWKLPQGWIIANKNELIKISEFINSKMQEYYDEEHDFASQVNGCKSVDELRALYQTVKGE